MIQILVINVTLAIHKNVKTLNRDAKIAFKALSTANAVLDGTFMGRAGFINDNFESARVQRPEVLF